MSGTILPTPDPITKARAAIGAMRYHEENRLAEVYYAMLSDEQKNELYNTYTIRSTYKNRRDPLKRIEDKIDEYGIPLPETHLTQSEMRKIKGDPTVKQLVINGLGNMLIHKKMEEEKARARNHALRLTGRMREPQVNIMALRGLRPNNRSRKPKNLLNFFSPPPRPVNLLNTPRYTAAQMQSNLAEVFNPAAGAPANYAGGRRRKHKTMKRRRS